MYLIYPTLKGSNMSSPRPLPGVKTSKMSPTPKGSNVALSEFAIDSVVRPLWGRFITLNINPRLQPGAIHIDPHSGFFTATYKMVVAYSNSCTLFNKEQGVHVPIAIGCDATKAQRIDWSLVHKKTPAKIDRR